MTLWLLLALAVAFALGLRFLRVRVHEPLERCLRKLQALAELPSPDAQAVSLARLTRKLESALWAAEVNVELLRKKVFHGDFSQQALLRSMIEGVLITDPSHRVVQANDALREMFRLKNSPVGLTLLESLRNTAIHEAIQEAFEGNRVQDVEVEATEASGRTFQMNASLMQDRDGRKIGVVAVFRDTTQLKRLATSRKEFVENVSHELRTPLTIIQGYLETLIDHPDLPAAERLNFLNIALSHSERLRALIGDILTISRFESEQAREAFQSGSRTPCDPGPILDRLARDFEPLARKKSIVLTVEKDPGLSRPLIDPFHLEQALFNLLDNAIKYTGDRGNVVLKALGEGESVEICVCDSGIGIPEQDLPHVFERFFRVDKARSRDMGGTGLGLSIVKHIVQAYGGKVWAESTIGVGSKFFLKLQAAPRPQAGHS